MKPLAWRPFHYIRHQQVPYYGRIKLDGMKKSKFEKPLKKHLRVEYVENDTLWKGPVEVATRLTLEEGWEEIGGSLEYI